MEVTKIDELFQKKLINFNLFPLISIYFYLFQIFSNVL